MNFIRPALMLFLVSAMTQSTGLSTPFVDVQLENVPLGKPFTVTHSSAEGLLLQNMESNPLRVSIQAFAPSTTDLKGHANVIPSVEWVRITPDHAVIPPHGRIQCRITLIIPNEKKYRNKEYQVMIWSRGEVSQSQGVGLSAGLISRLRFKTESGS